MCQDSDALLLVEHRVEKTSAAFLLRDEPAGFITRTRHIFPTRNRAADPIQTISPQGAVDEGGRIVWLSAEVTSKHLSSRAFLQAARRETAAAVASVEKNAEGQDEEDVIAEAEAAAAVIAARLQEGYADLAECALLLLQAGTTAGAEESPKAKAKAKGKSSKHAGGLQPVDTKAAARMERGGRQVLTALDGLLAPGPYLRSLAPLLEHEDGRVRRKALRLIAHRLHAAAAADVAPANKYEKRKGEKARDARSRARAKDRKWKRSGKATTATTEDEDAEAEEMEEERADEAEAGVALIEKLAELAGSGSYATRSAALAALDAASSRFAGVKDAHKPIIDAAPAAVESLSCSSRAVVAAGAGCIASIVKSQGVRCVGILPNAVPKLLETANSAASSLAKAKDAAARAAAEAEEAGDEAAEEEASEAAGVRDDEAAVLVAALKAVDTLMEQLSAFVSPYLPEMLRLLLSPALVPAVGGDDGEDAFDRESSAYHAAQSAAALREIVARRIPHRLLLKPLAEAYDSCLAAGGVGGAAAARSALGMAAVAASTEPPAPAHRGALVALLLRALDVRREPPAGRCPAAAVDEVEAAAVQAFVTFSLQLTESSFVPVFTQVVEWAKARAADAPAARTRLGALFRLASSLADALRAVFVPLATPLLDLAAAALDPVSDPAPSKKKEEEEEQRRRRRGPRRDRRGVGHVAHAHARALRASQALRARRRRGAARREPVQPAAPAGDADAARGSAVGGTGWRTHAGGCGGGAHGARRARERVRGVRRRDDRLGSGRRAVETRAQGRFAGHAGGGGEDAAGGARRARGGGGQAAGGVPGAAAGGDPVPVGAVRGSGRGGGRARRGRSRAG